MNEPPRSGSLKTIFDSDVLLFIHLCSKIASLLSVKSWALFEVAYFKVKFISKANLTTHYNIQRCNEHI